MSDALTKETLDVAHLSLSGAQRERLNEKFDKLYEENCRAAFLFARKHFGSHSLDEVEDFMVEGRGRMWRGWIRENGNIPLFKTYLIRCVLNAGLDYIKHQRGRPADSLESVMGVASLQPTANPMQIEDPWPPLEIALSRVPAHQRRLLLLFGQEGASYEEIAEITGIPIGTVKSRLFRGREILLEQLQRLGLNYDFFYENVAFPEVVGRPGIIIRPEAPKVPKRVDQPAQKKKATEKTGTRPKVRSRTTKKPTPTTEPTIRQRMKMALKRIQAKEGDKK